MFAQLRERWAASSRSARLAAIGVLTIGLLATGVYAYLLDQGYALELWLCWTLLGLWARMLLFNAACASFGQMLVVRVFGFRELPALESAVLAMASGVVAFGLAMYGLGALGWFRTSVAFALPLAMLASGAQDGSRLARRLWVEWHTPEPRQLLTVAIGGAGVLCVAIVYLGVLSPDALNYDAGWSHQVVAQEYARNGRIVPFLADYNRNVPHFASVLYTWSYLVLGFNQPVRWMLALHTEFCLFLWTLAGVSAALARLVTPVPLRGWVGFFLFPAIFVYDSNLGGAADHVCGFFAIPVALAALRLCERFTPGRGALFALVSGAALLTKLQALFLIAPALLTLGVCWLVRLYQLRSPAEAESARERRALLWTPLWIAGVGLLVFAPHAIRQLVFHANPVYPFLQDVFSHSVPTVPDAAFLVSHALADPVYQPPGTFFDKLVHGLELFFTFSFVPHYSFTKDVPSFGSLFTLLLPCLVFFRRNRRLLLMAAMAAGAVLTWGMVYNVDRNLQVFMPVLVCVTVALIVSCWRLGFVARIGLVPLVALQIVWGGDALFYSQNDRINDGMDLIKSGFDSEAHKRFRRYRRSYRDMNKVLPIDARVLLHAEHVSLGIQREVLVDGMGFQGLFSYRHLTTPRELYLYLKRFGVTHLVENPTGPSAPTGQEEVLWDAFTAVYAERVANFGDRQVLRMPKAAPPEAPTYRVICLGLDAYANGLYPVTDLRTMRFLPEEQRIYAAPERRLPAAADAFGDFLAQADALIIGKGFELTSDQKSQLKRQYTIIRKLDEMHVFLNRRLMVVQH